MNPQSERMAGLESASFYGRAALAQAGRLLSLLDREADSISFGSWDREHWGWKFRDFPLGMPQTGIHPLALLWKYDFPGSSFRDNSRLLDWILAILSHTLDRQHANGAFDAFCPNEQDPDVTLGVMYGLGEAVRLLGPAIPASLSARFLDSLRKACDFSLQRDSGHAFISNHWALFALAFLDGHELLGESRYRARAEEIVDRILGSQSADGWYLEYGGPDPGYESLGISHLASYWQRTRSERLLDSLRRSVEFYSYCVHPDGSVGGIYGSRHTQQYFPAGFELLSAEIPLAASVAHFMRRRLERGNVVTLENVDMENLSVLARDYLQASLAAADTPTSLLALPCEKLDGEKRFPAGGISFAGSSCYYAVVNAAKGGVCRIFYKQNSTLAYEDAGYLAQAGDKLWTSQRPAPGFTDASTATHETVAEVRFTEVRQELPTPGKFLLLRLANLTLFRSLALGAWLRRQIVLRLIISSRPGPLRLTRRVKFEENEIRFSDRIEAERPLAVDRVSLVRSFTAIHMGSAKYFHPAEMEETPLPDTTNLAHELGAGRAAICEFRLQFTAGAKPALLSGVATSRAEAAQPEGTLTRP